MAEEKKMNWNDEEVEKAKQKLLNSLRQKEMKNQIKKNVGKDPKKAAGTLRKWLEDS